MFLIQQEKDRTSQKLIEQLHQNQIMGENMLKEPDGKAQQKTKEPIKPYSQMEKQKKE